jgi:DNA-directed RNA polymerase specialized sigma24 family protein
VTPELTRDELLAIAKVACTPAQLEAIELYEQERGYRPIARRLGIGVTTVRDRIDRGMERVERYRQEHQ